MQAVLRALFLVRVVFAAGILLNFYFSVNDFFLVFTF